MHLRPLRTTQRRKKEEEKLDYSNKRKRSFLILSLVTVFSVMISVSVLADTEKKIDDRSISHAIEEGFLTDHAVPFNKIDVKTKHGVVTLTGTVDNIMVKERAARIAETVKGVRAVINSIEVAPRTLHSDHQIQKDIQAALTMNRRPGLMISVWGVRLILRDKLFVK